MRTTIKQAFGVLLALSSLLNPSCSESKRDIKIEEVVDTTPADNKPFDNSQKDDSVRIDLSIEKINLTTYNLVINLKLFGDSWIVSPLAYDYPYGHLRIDLELKNHLTKVDSLLENPKSVEFYDESYEGSYPLIKEKVTLTQKLKIKTRDDFKVHGLVFFVLEPICTPYELTFILNYQNGEMKVDQVNFEDVLNRPLPEIN